MTWQERGLCVSYGDPDLWFPSGYQRVEDRGQVEVARALCWDCPVRVECLRWAVGVDGDKGEEDGVWGGSTPDDRKALRKLLKARAGAALDALGMEAA